MAQINNTDDNLCWRGCKVQWIRLHYWWECKLVQPLGMSMWQFLRKSENNLLQDPVIPCLGTYSKDDKLCHKDMSSTIFIAALFVIARTQKKLNAPQWKNGQGEHRTFTHSRKNNEILNIAGKRMELENIILSEVTQTQKHHYHMYSLISVLTHTLSTYSKFINLVYKHKPK